MKKNPRRMNSSNEIEEWLKRTGKCLVILFGVNMLGILTIAYPILVGGILITGGSAVIFYMVVEVIRRRKNIFRATYYYKNRLIFIRECKKNKKHLINFPKEIEGFVVVKKCL